MRIPSFPFVSLLAALLVPIAAGAQTSVALIVVGSAEVDATAEVEWLPFGEVSAQELTRGQALGIDDELRSAGGDVVVELACSDSATVVLSGRFRALVQPTDGGQSCVLRVLSGVADAVGTDSTTLEFGDVVAGSEATHYSVVVGPAEGRPGGRVVVYDGSVRIRSRARRLEESVTAGSTAVVTATRVALVPVEEAMVDYTASVLSRLDAAQVLRRTDVPAESLRRELYEGYRAVLRDPDDPEARLRLGAIGARDSIPSRVLLYQLDRVEKLDRSRSAAALYMKAPIYTARGDTAAAAAAVEKSVREDSRVISEVQRVYDVPNLRDLTVSPDLRPREEVAPPPEMVVRMAASPKRAGIGERVTLVVRVTTAAGKAVAGAEVTVSAGGGTMAASGSTEVTGRTNRTGEFRTAWSCTRCAPAYVITAKVRGDGGEGSAEVRVDIGGRGGSDSGSPSTP